jgi:hypothetical protein
VYVRINRVVSEEDWVHPYPTDFVLGGYPIDDIRELKTETTFMEENFTSLTAIRSL